MSTGPRPTALVDYLRLATDYLKKCGSDSARLDAELLLAHVLGLDRVALYVNHDRPLVPDEVDAFREMLRRRCQGMPIAYITGERAFLSTTVQVSPAVLIPRPETELLVEAVVDWLGRQSGSTLMIADVGTGSGAIAIGIALAEPRATVAALDVSADALSVAGTNVERHQLVARIELVSGDLLTPLLVPPRGDVWAGRLDAVVSNPPYVATKELETLPRDVRDYEPRVALDGGEDGLAVYRRLIPMAARVLRPGGLLALEIGADQRAAVAALLAEAASWRNVRVRQDYAGHDRVVLAEKAEKESTDGP